ncbi:dynactin subunit 3-like isoform X4 [Aquila chrysaetos chrysaetos]|uniref:dynactin subunit 3-like isoform X4 n=1 Tax=Aquila chrysaetos chrysaetos TaxID=223781 RepID=UPI001B7D383E|nr:dynactin subunit 3-like isoform X4 [Aquila chrysaetos chrysaetos]
MAAGLVELRRLQWRLEELEQRVGDGTCGPRKVADELVKVQVALSNIAGKRERIKILFKKIEDVIKYLDPQYIDRMAVPDAMKLQFILAEEQVIPSRAALLEQVKNLQPILESASIQDLRRGQLSTQPGVSKRFLTMQPNYSDSLKSAYSSRNSVKISLTVSRCSLKTTTK